jgi:hypothetical protein
MSFVFSMMKEACTEIRNIEVSPEKLILVPDYINMGLYIFITGLKRGRGLTLTTHPHLVPKSRMSRSYTLSPPSAFMACSGTALLYYIFKLKIRQHNYHKSQLI